MDVNKAYAMIVLQYRHISRHVGPLKLIQCHTCISYIVYHTCISYIVCHTCPLYLK